MISLCTDFMWVFFFHLSIEIFHVMNYGIYLIDNQFSIKIGQMYGSKTLTKWFFFFKEKTIFCILLSRSHVHARLII